jgi:hypothetical protein
MNPYKEWNCGDTTVQYNKLASDSYEIAFATLFKSRQLENGINFKTLPNGGAMLNGKRCREIRDQ